MRSNLAAGNLVRPGDLLRVVADGLISRGFILENPGQDRERSVAIKCTDGTQSQLTVQDDGSVRLDYRPAPGPYADPMMLTEIAARLLIGGSDAHSGQERGLTQKGMVGREVRAPGVTVCLEVRPGDDVIDVAAEVVAACLNVSADTKVRITDGSSLAWERVAPDQERALSSPVPVVQPRASAGKAASTRAEQAQLSRAMHDEGCSWREIADELARRWNLSHLQAFRLAHGMSQEQAAERYNARWHPPRPLTGKHISYWEMWPARTGKQPSLNKLRMLAEVYECTLSDLLAEQSLNEATSLTPASRTRLSPYAGSPSQLARFPAHDHAGTRG